MRWTTTTGAVSQNMRMSHFFHSTLAIADLLPTNMSCLPLKGGVTRPKGGLWTYPLGGWSYGSSLTGSTEAPEPGVRLAHCPVIAIRGGGYATHFELLSTEDFDSISILHYSRQLLAHLLNPRLRSDKRENLVWYPESASVGKCHPVSVVTSFIKAKCPSLSIRFKLCYRQRSGSADIPDLPRRGCSRGRGLIAGLFYHRSRLR